jgi:predicted nucleic acid-binding protein
MLVVLGANISVSALITPNGLARDVRPVRLRRLPDTVRGIGASNSAADHLVTGDNDLLDLQDPPIPITKLHEFAGLLWQGEEGAAGSSRRR